MSYSRIVGALFLALLVAGMSGCGEFVEEARDTTAPTVTANSPASGTASIPLNVRPTVTFSEDMDSATISTSNISLETAAGAAVTISLIYAARVATISFTGNLAASTTYEVTVSTGVKDAAGNALAAAHTFSFTTGTSAYSGAPSVESVSAAAGATNVSANITPTATFNRVMNSGSLRANFTLRVLGGTAVTGTATVSADGRTVYFTPSSALAYNTTYEATIAASTEDSAGNQLGSAYTWRFTTAPSAGQVDITAPTVTTTPTNGATGIATNSNITLVFNEAVNSSTVNTTNITMRAAAAGTSVSGTVTYEATTYVATFDPTANLSYDTTYEVTISGVSDLAGNQISSTTVSFRTKAESWDAQASGVPTTTTLEAVYFVNSTTGWVVGHGGVIRRTTNGGTTWSAQTSGVTVNLYGVHFVDANNGWAVGDNGTVLRTSNGGTAWSAQTTGTLSTLANVAFANANNGWVVGMGTMEGGIILRTTNGGTDWSSQATASFLMGAAFVSSTVGWAVGQGGTILTWDGTTWSAQTSGVAAILGDTVFINSTTGWVVGMSGTILNTSNGGTAWSAQTSGTTQSLMDVSFVDANYGWVVGANGTILRTSNGGTAWSAQTSGTTNILWGVHFVDAYNGWAVGDSGTILYHSP